MDELIFTSIKSMLGIDLNFNGFDSNIQSAINSSIFSLKSIGVVNSDFILDTQNKTWKDLTDEKRFSSVQTYVYLKTKLVFDPPSNTTIINSLEKQLSEIEWRLNLEANNV